MPLRSITISSILLLCATIMQPTTSAWRLKNHTVAAWSTQHNVTGLRVTPDVAEEKFCWRVPSSSSFFCYLVTAPSNNNDDGNRTCSIKFTANNNATILSNTIRQHRVSAGRVLIGYYERDPLIFADIYLLKIASLVDVGDCRQLPLNDLTKINAYAWVTRHHVVTSKDAFDVIRVDAHQPHERTTYEMFRFDKDGRSIGNSTRLLSGELFNKVVRKEAFARVKDPDEEQQAGLLYGIFDLPVEKVAKVYRIAASGAKLREWTYKTAP